MSIKSDALIIRDETSVGANTAVRIGTNLIDIADDLLSKQGEVDLNTAKKTYPDVDGIKLSGIEALADVTSNSGALMDSEITNLEEVKAFSSADYATAAQGLTADLAQQELLEGAFVNGDKTKLNSIEAGADVSTINSTTAGEPTGSQVVLNIVTLTQAEYDAGIKVANTFYAING
jgi:hypothetical protein